jgi:outer membrane protein OmpA-like peptidoglycan-associated protein
MDRYFLASVIVVTGLIAQPLGGAVAQQAPALGTPAPNVSPPSVPAPPTPVPFGDAVLKAANDLFSKARLPADAPSKVQLVIDPLIDGMTGAQSRATQDMGRRISQLVATSYQNYEVRPFSAESITKSPVVLIGTLTPINNATNRSDGVRDAYRICLALADLKTKKIISKGVARVKPETVDATPTRYFNDTPVFSKDAATEAYIKSCQGTQPGDAINEVYADRILVSALINDAFDAYEGERYQDAVELYRSALHTPGGEQLRVLNGLYLSSWKLKRREQTAEAFRRIVDYGLANERLGVKLLFRTGSAQLLPEKTTNAPYDMWLKQIAEGAAAKNACLEVTGHTSPSGTAALNDRLSQLRAQYIKERVEEVKPQLVTHTIAGGLGSRQNLIGTGKDDATDVLDRRVEFKILDCADMDARRASLLGSEITKTPTIIAARAPAVVSPTPASVAGIPVTQLDVSAIPALNREGVRRVQQVLKDKGFDPGLIDGVTGPRMQDAVRAFQKQYGIASNGGVDNQTLLALGEAELASQSNR